MKLVGVPAPVLYFLRLPGIVFGRGQHERTRAGGHLVPVHSKQFVERQACRLGGDVIEADVEGAIGVNRNVVPPAVVHAKVLPVFFARQRILTQEKRFQGRGPDLPGHFGAAPGKTEGIALHAFAGLHRNHEEIEGRFPPIRISESDMLSRVFLQTRISIELMAIVSPLWFLN